jgi:AAA family ATP:ADP antiporter
VVADPDHQPAAEARQPALSRLLARAVDVRRDEIRALLWSFAYFFFLLSSYYVLRPLRDEMGIAGGVEQLPWLFTATFVAMALAVPLYGVIVARFPRRRFLPLVYRFFILNILIFFVLLLAADDRTWVARGFFVWVSVFNLFVVSVFWSFMADLFREEQGRRLFGFIAAGGSLGALIGPAITVALAVPLGPVNLLLVSALLLELAVRCIRRLAGNAADTAAPREAVIGGGSLAGFSELARSPYLLGIGLYIVGFTSLATLLYFEQAHIVAGAFDDPAERTRLFATIDLLVGILTILTQLFVTGRLMRRFGVGVALMVLPVVMLLGFVLLATAPTVAVLIGFQAIRRASNFAISRPAREVLFTVVTREQKYKSKNVIDTLVYRGSDAASGWLFAGLSGLGLGLSWIALLTAPFAALWAVLAYFLGRSQRLRAAAMAADGDHPGRAGLS